MPSLSLSLPLPLSLCLSLTLFCLLPPSLPPSICISRILRTRHATPCAECQLRQSQGAGATGCISLSIVLSAKQDTPLFCPHTHTYTNKLVSARACIYPSRNRISARATASMEETRQAPAKPRLSQRLPSHS